MKKILAATDFSKAATNAVMYASDLAEALYADLVILHAATLPVNPSEVPVAISEAEILEDAEKNLAKLKQDINNRSKGKVIVETIAEANPFFYSLKENCQKIMPYMVVIGMQGKTKMEKIILGSHATHTLQKLTWPVLAVPPTATFSKILKIGFACDFDHVVESIPVDEIKRFILDFNAELHIINIGSTSTYDPELVFQSGLMQELLLSLKPDYHFIEGDNFDRGIMDFAMEKKFDLLLVVPRQHNILDRILHKSHTKQFALHSHIPVLALHG